MKRLILAVNPGSTSTKFALYEEDKMIFEKSLNHPHLELSSFEKISDQYGYRKKFIMQELIERNVDLNRIKAVVGRGGLLKSIESGIYKVNEAMRKDLKNGIRGQHAANLGGLIAYEIAGELKDARAYIVDPVVVDEMEAVARQAGHPDFSRKSIFHALNQKAVGRVFASARGLKYEEVNLVVAHMGGGISIGAHQKGKVIDVNNAYNGEGPFSPERTGGLPTGQIVEYCFDSGKSKEDILKLLTRQGGMLAYLGTNDFREICRRVSEGDKNAKLIQESASYQIGKEIGAMAAALKGKVDAIILTGGMAYQKLNTDYITRMVSHIGEIVIYPGEDELKSLSYNGLLALDNKREIKTYL